jgi:hypothetical protein
LLTFVPVLGAPLAHAPVLRFDLLKPLKRPIDGGRTLNGRRLLGDNKTWRGAPVLLACRSTSSATAVGARTTAI